MRKRRVGVTAGSGQIAGNRATGSLQIESEIAAPLELRTPRSTAAKAANRVRMEAWRQWRWSQWTEGQSEKSSLEKRERDLPPRSGARKARMRRCLILRQGASPLKPPNFPLDREWPSHGSRDRQGAVSARHDGIYRCRISTFFTTVDEGLSEPFTT